MDLKKLAFNNITRNFRAYLGYYLSSTFSIMIFFAFAVAAFHPMITNSGMESASMAGMVLATTELMILGFSMIFVIYSLSNFIKSRSREFGTLIVMGMGNKQFKKIILFENLIVGIFSIVSGIVLGLLLSKVFLKSLSNIFYMDLSNFYFPTKAIIITLVAFILLFMITGPFTLMSINKKGMLDLLKGEQKPKKEIKSSKIQGMLGILLIITSYILILFGNELHLNISVYTVAGIAILGLYLFFSQFTVMLLNNLKNKEYVYKKNTNMLLISNLVYKMKDNARLLFLITVLLSGTLMAFTSSETIVNSQAESSKSNFPMVYSYFSYKGNPDKARELNAIKDAIKDYNYTEVNFATLDVDSAAVLNVSNYNKLAKEINVNKINLNKNEAMLVPIGNNKDNKSKLDYIKEYKIDNKNLNVVKVADKQIFPTGMYSKGVVVVSDELYSQIEGKYDKEDFYGFNYDNWINTSELTSKLRKESFNYNYDEERYSTILTLPDMYSVELQQSKVLQFMGISIGTIFSVAVLSFLYFRLFTDEAVDRVKYTNLSKLGLSNNDMKKIVNKELGALFLIPFILSAINTVVGVVFVNEMFNISMKISDFKILALIFVMYVIYFILVKNKYIKNIWSENR